MYVNKIVPKSSRLHVKFIIFIFLVFIMNLCPLKVHATVQATYYVSASGSDSNPGTYAQPFATLSKARNVVGTMNSNMTGDIYVYIRAGDYYVNSTIDFTETDSGTNGYNIIYKNYDTAGSAHFIGGQRITGWTQYAGSIYRANIGTTWKFNTLYENGKRAVKARYPNKVTDSSFPSSQGTYLLSEGLSGSNTILQYKSGDLDPSGWDISDAQVFIWSGANVAGARYTDTVPISSINASIRQITMTQPARYGIDANSRYFIQGVLQLLDQPGEFYLDSEAGYLYYWARDGAIESQTIIAPKVKTIISLTGRSESARVHNIRFEGLTFECTEFTDWYRGGWVNDGDASLETGKQITDLPGFSQSPVVNPYGNWVYIQSKYSGEYQWYRSRLDGSEFENLTKDKDINNGNMCFGDAISNDGKKIAYVSHNGSIGKIVVANADGSEPEVVSPPNQYCYMLAFNPAGTDIVYSNNSLGYKIQKVNIESGVVTSLTPGFPNSYMPRFTPDGQKIIFTNIDNNIYSMNQDGTNMVNLTNNNLFYYEWRMSSLDTHGSSEIPSISPDGTKIAYSQNVNGIAQVYVMNIDGTGKTQLTNGSSPCVRAKWSPDGTKIAYVSRVGSYYWQLFVMNSAGGSIEQKTDFNGAVRNYDWTPDSKKIVYTRMIWGSGEYDPGLPYTGDIYTLIVNPDTHTYNQYDRRIEMTQHRTGMILMENTDHLTIEACRFINSGYSAVFMLNYNQYNTVYGNAFQHLGYSAIYLEGRYPGEGDVLKYNTISNNCISDIGELVGHAAGIYVMNSSNNEISYSEIFNCPRYAVAWESYPDIPASDTYTDNNVFSYLKIHDCCQDSGVTGSLYSCGTSNNTPSITNTVQQVTIDSIYAHPSISGYVNGIFMDNDSWGQTFTNVKITNTQDDLIRNYDSGSHSNTNVNWTGTFDDSLMDYANIGLKSDYVYERPLSSDGFENGFKVWVTGKGSASVSTVQKHSGSYSYVINENEDVIYQRNSNMKYNKVGVLWFYDDASDTTMECMARIDNGAWDDSYSWRGMGVDTSITNGDTKYVYRVGMDEIATGITRTTGWHRLVWDYRSGTGLDMYIDGTLIASPAGINYFNNVAMGDWWNSNRTGTNYFDDFEIRNTMP